MFTKQNSRLHIIDRKTPLQGLITKWIKDKLTLRKIANN